MDTGFQNSQIGFKEGGCHLFDNDTQKTERRSGENISTAMFESEC